MTLTEFLLARIADDEAVARAAEAHYDAADWSVSGPEDWPVLWGYLPVRSSVDPGTIEPKVAAHVVRQGPARVLAECAAKRTLVAAYDDQPEDGTIAAVLALAAVWSDHPDYDEAWRP